VEVFVAEPTDDYEIVPLGPESDAERQRIRRSNDRDQRREREGQPAPHNEGYDEVADGPRRPAMESVTGEDEAPPERTTHMNRTGNMNRAGEGEQRERLDDLERTDPSGHGMQTPPGRQKDIAENSDVPEKTARVNPAALDDLKGEDQTA
jgi:hypothetical protein